MRELLGVREVAKSLGVPEATIRYWAWTRRLRHYKLGRHLKFDRGDLDKFIEANLVEEGSNGHI